MFRFRKADHALTFAPITRAHARAREKVTFGSASGRHCAITGACCATVNFATIIRARARGNVTVVLPQTKKPQENAPAAFLWSVFLTKRVSPKRPRDQSLVDPRNSCKKHERASPVEPRLRPDNPSCLQCDRVRRGYTSPAWTHRPDE